MISIHSFSSIPISFFYSATSITLTLIHFHSNTLIPFHFIILIHFLFIFWLLILTCSVVSSPFIIHRSHSFHPILFSFLFSIHLFSSLLIFVSQLWYLIHVCSVTCYLIIIWCVDRKHSQSIRRNCFCVWWLIREQWHRMMRKWENEYLKTQWYRCIWSSHYRSWFHQMINEGYLHQSNTKSILSKITEPIAMKL